MAYRIEKISIKQVGIEEPGKETIKTAFVAVGSGSNQPRHVSFVMTEKEFNALNDGVKIGSKKLKNKNGEICEVTIIYLIDKEEVSCEISKELNSELSNRRDLRKKELEGARVGFEILVFLFFCIFLFVLYFPNFFKI
jgi:hypothetical protein